ncbi:MAG: hypothetical protein F6K31_15795 [Symploca sp. SIO2G7]|nr:hypothetical protein [Symploca sp. SIO2G7]
MDWQTEQLASAAEKLGLEYLELVSFLGKMERLSPQELAVIQGHVMAKMTNQFKQADV